MNAVDSKLLGSEPPFLQAGGKCSDCFLNQIAGEVGLISSSELDDGSRTLDGSRENDTFDRGEGREEEENGVVVVVVDADDEVGDVEEEDEQDVVWLNSVLFNGLG